MSTKAILTSQYGAVLLGAPQLKSKASCYSMILYEKSLIKDEVCGASMQLKILKEDSSCIIQYISFFFQVKYTSLTPMINYTLTARHLPQSAT